MSRWWWRHNYTRGGWCSMHWRGKIWRKYKRWCGHFQNVQIKKKIFILPEILNIMFN
ncbi:hypothetical protein GLOIN_2v1554735 [Rhizophagus irregularis DAOM 181602=DAOM 197198]|uniref:Uncharacterized protein n=1 Tax=Rhizophagus irregularis (strain DAOM 181602 / DAOM 197198 / MUCL 43194) TaxID=747089 RepID=A0A2P4QGA4_RHIID|nr:hypothetical protein GLOIN_2v1554735 [Rhizophagus irregularis DAOM 181602=DAOM 197198]POG76658.1 hypothetical protein GLOIN_2v1554735 [Rhizophagus irregularis DAOM 181602=DAOM 197198]|eukprot:XP_025183524.1 hypothetical protein GLOIN_2v1554735 [Rhizophagus irregularis DAOM 181602=DAOM 197198]